MVTVRSRRSSSSSFSSLGGSATCPKGTCRDGSEVQILVDFHFLVVADGNSLIALYFEEFVISRNSRQLFYLCTGQLMLRGCKGIVVHENRERMRLVLIDLLLFHWVLLRPSGIDRLL